MMRIFFKVYPRKRNAPTVSFWDRRKEKIYTFIAYLINETTLCIIMCKKDGCHNQYWISLYCLCPVHTGLLQSDVLAAIAPSCSWLHDGRPVSAQLLFTLIQVTRSISPLPTLILHCRAWLHKKSSRPLSMLVCDTLNSPSSPRQSTTLLTFVCVYDFFHTLIQSKVTFYLLFWKLTRSSHYFLSDFLFNWCGLLRFTH